MWKEGGTAKGGTVIFVEAQWGGRNGRARNGEYALARSPVQLAVHAESRAYVSAHGFCKRGTIAMFHIIFANLDAGSYLHMIPEIFLQRNRSKIRICTFSIAWSRDIILCLLYNLRTEYP